MENAGGVHPLKIKALNRGGFFFKMEARS